MVENVFSLFSDWTFEPSSLLKLQRLIRGSRCYILYFTPRCGSTFFSDLLKKTALAGRPGEFLNPLSMPNTLNVLSKKNVKISGIVKYIEWMHKNRKTPNNVFGCKVTYVHYKPFIESGLDGLFFSNFHHFMLYRRNLVKQAISLYISSETNVFHTNVHIPGEAKQRAHTIAYDKEKIRFNVQRLWTQECGWDAYFQKFRFPVVKYNYDDIAARPVETVLSMLQTIGVELPSTDSLEPGTSVFKRVGTSRNDELAKIFLSDRGNLSFLEKLGVGLDRCEGL